MLDTLTRIKLLKDYRGKKAGSVFGVDGDIQDLLDEGIAEIYDEEAEKKKADEEKRAQEKDDERFMEGVKRALKDVLEKDSKNRPLITVGRTGQERAHDADGDFPTFAHHLKAVWEADNPTIHKALDSRLLKVGEMGETDDAQGGYLVPTQFRAELFEILHKMAEIIQRTFQIPMQTNRIQMPAIAETSRVDGSRHGGLTVYWVHEAGEKVASKPTFRQITLALNKLAGLVHVSDELLSDSPISVEAIIKRLFAEELMFVLEQSFVDGTGAGQPLGIMNAGCLVTQAAEVPQAAATIVYMNIARMWSRMWGSCRKNAIWLINQDAEPELMNMGLAVGVGGGPAYLPAGGLSATPYATLLGRPVFQCEHCQTLGTTGDIILADFSQYLYGRKTTGIETATSMHYRFIYDQQSFRFVLRADGQPWWASELTPKHGTNTMSPFVALATRP